MIALSVVVAESKVMSKDLCTEKVLLNATTYLTAAAIWCGMQTCCGSITSFATEDDFFEFMMALMGINCVSAVIDIAWCVVGGIVTIGLSSECLQSMSGKMVMSYLIIKSMVIGVECTVIIIVIFSANGAEQNYVRGFRRRSVNEETETLTMGVIGSTVLNK